MTDDSPAERRLLESLHVQGESSTDLLPRIYGELRSVANRLMGNERSSHTLQPTALVHEAFLRIGEGEAMERLAYLATAARVMRHVLIDHARGRDTDKRGGSWKRVTLQGVLDDSGRAGEVDVVRLDEALTRLAELDERQARIVELRFFSGMTGQEIAEHLGVSRNTVVRELTVSRAWLQRAMSRMG